MIEVCVLRKDEFAATRATDDETTINGDVDLQKCLKCLNYAKITNFKVIDFLKSKKNFFSFVSSKKFSKYSLKGRKNEAISTLLAY